MKGEGDCRRKREGSWEQEELEDMEGEQDTNMCMCAIV